MLHVEIIFCSDYKLVELGLNILKPFAEIIFNSIKVAKAIEINLLWHTILRQIKHMLIRLWCCHLLLWEKSGKNLHK